MDGFLLVDKPAGISSFGVVDRIRKIASQDLGKRLKVGHTGTLDPAATGLLILVLGNYTRKAGEFSALDKVYEAEVMLGLVSTTGDREGKISRRSNLEPTKEEIGLALKTLLGTIDQKPPPYSAIKVGGQRAYKLARQGQNPVLEPRKVTIYDTTDVRYDYPVIKFIASVSSGTYIRSLAIDIGEELATGAYLSALRRTKVGDFDVKDALPLERIDFASLTKNLQQQAL
jgi:tRNA pseudouridine55 synthase